MERGGASARTAGAGRIKKRPCIVEAQSVIHGVMKVAFDDGFVGVVDLRPLVGKGGALSWPKAPEHFATVKIDEFGHTVSWIDDRGYVIDFSADSLRRDAERQAEMRRLMVS